MIKLLKILIVAPKMACLLAEIYDWTKYKQTPWAKQVKETLDYILK